MKIIQTTNGIIIISYRSLNQHWPLIHALNYTELRLKTKPKLKLKLGRDFEWAAVTDRPKDMSGAGCGWSRWRDRAYVGGLWHLVWVGGTRKEGSRGNIRSQLAIKEKLIYVNNVHRFYDRHWNSIECLYINAYICIYIHSYVYIYIHTYIEWMPT